jgi:hypothetical protein
VLTMPDSAAKMWEYISAFAVPEPRMIMGKDKLRTTSIVLGVCAYTLPFLFLSWQKSQMAAEGVHCGLPYLAALGMSTIFAILLSVVGAMFNLITWDRRRRPYSWLQIAELALIGLPVIAGLVLIGCICLF